MAYHVRRVDNNQKLITTQLRRLGVSVAVTSSLSKGFPDLVLGYKGQNYLIELKDESQPPSKRGLTEDEVKWHQDWNGQIAVCKNLDEILDILNL